MRSGLTRVVVVIPAHDEEQLLPACLDALGLAAVRSPVPVDVLVVLDACRDATAATALAGGAEILAVEGRNVGAARAAGAAEALAGAVPARTWLACTDADTRVPPYWIERQLDHADRGADVVTGTVQVDDWAEWPSDTTTAYLAAYRRGVTGDRHPHVHGANLGLTGAAYLRAGGFPPIRTSEDRALVRAAERAGLRVARATDVPVLTSARRSARASGGFSDHLHDLTG